MHTIQKSFALLIAISLFLLIVINYKNYQFSHNPLSKKIYERISQKENQIRQKIRLRYGLDIKIEIKIVDKLHENLFGLATYDDLGKISILLNKKRFQESEDYMIEYVLPHEYAHAMMFVLKNFTKQNGGHTKEWQQICINIGGLKCDRFVKHNDIIMGKI